MKCVKICQIDPSGTYCVGCNRTTKEIFEAGISKTNVQDMEKLNNERHLNGTFDKHIDQE
jgi:predicted Fe-S protein YdhL (DUF1289 family)